MTGYGYPESAIARIVTAECVLVVLYLVPQTSVLAAIVLTGYLGGAVAAHVRVADTARAVIPLAVESSPGRPLPEDRRIRQLLPFAGRREPDRERYVKKSSASEASRHRV